MSSARETRSVRKTRSGFVALLALIFQYLAGNQTGQTAEAMFDPAPQLHRSIPEISKCRQLVVVTTVVTTMAWDVANATIQRFERRRSGQMSWQRVGEPLPGVIGKGGFAWGIGLHGTGKAGEPNKREGDQRSPAGVFRLSCVFGHCSATLTRVCPPQAVLEVALRALQKGTPVDVLRRGLGRA
jgi:L,D-peptidoglycan transpeptidase YkuD (ErfK/YbiS/YcfS/YnhG family)